MYTDEKIQPVLMGGKDSLSIVVPLFNEQIYVIPLIEILSVELDKTGMVYEIILVDDGSTDQTWDRIESISHEYEVVRALRLSRNFGKEHALRAGIENAMGAAVITMDGDLQHPPELIHDMLTKWKEGTADIIEAEKRGRQSDSTIMRLRAKVFYSVFSRLTGFEMRGATDFKLIDRKVLSALLLMPERELFYRGMTAWLGFRVEKIPFDVSARSAGASKWSFVSLLRYAISATTSFTSTPLYLIGGVGFAFFFMSLVVGIKACYLWFIGDSLPGYTTLLLILMITGASIMLALAIIGRYLSMIFNEIKQRPKYVVACEINKIK